MSLIIRKGDRFVTKDFKTTLADAIPNEDCLTVEDLSKHFNFSTLRMRQLITKALKEKLVQNLTKKDGRRILYTPQFVDQFRKAADSGKLGKFNKKKGVAGKVNLKSAIMILQVPVFDSEIAKLLIAKYNDENNISKQAQILIENTVKPILARKRELEEKYNQEIKNLFNNEASL